MKVCRYIRGASWALLGPRWPLLRSLGALLDPAGPPWALLGTSARRHASPELVLRVVGHHGGHTKNHPNGGRCVFEALMDLRR